MDNSTVSHRITFTTTTPHDDVYLAGSFTNPPWRPQKMRLDTTDGHERTFSAQVRVQPGRDYQYKIKFGQGDDWALKDDTPIVMDEDGNQNNLLHVPRQATSTPASGSLLAAKLQQDLGNDDRRPSTPVELVAQTAAEVADTAAMLDAVQSTPRAGSLLADDDDLDTGFCPPLFAHECLDDQTNGSSNADGSRARSIPRVETRAADDDDMGAAFRSPLFAHECLGAYIPGFADADAEVGTSPSKKDHTSTQLHGRLFSSDVDLQDPTIERFPSEKSSIMDALRRIQSSMSDDLVQLDDMPPSPRVAPDSGSRRTSIDSSDEALLTPGSLSPTSSRKRDSRPSHGSFGRSRSAISLGSIAEEDAKPETGRGLGGALELTATKQKYNKVEIDSLDSLKNADDQVLSMMARPGGGLRNPAPELRPSH